MENYHIQIDRKTGHHAVEILMINTVYCIKCTVCVCVCVCVCDYKMTWSKWSVLVLKSL